MQIKLFYDNAVDVFNYDNIIHALFIYTIRLKEADHSAPALILNSIFSWPDK